MKQVDTLISEFCKNTTVYLYRMHPKVSPYSKFHSVESFFWRNNLNLCGNNTKRKSLIHGTHVVISRWRVGACVKKTFTEHVGKCSYPKKNFPYRYLKKAEKTDNFFGSIVRKLLHCASNHSYHTANNNLFEIHYPTFYLIQN